MKKLTAVSLLGIAVALFGLAVSAEAAPINGRQANQHARIHQGVHDGSLTYREAARLGREQRAIAREGAYFRRDGVLGPWERAKLQHDLNRASRHIYIERHDAQRRY
jgi:hypothetical protein